MEKYKKIGALMTAYLCTASLMPMGVSAEVNPAAEAKAKTAVAEKKSAIPQYLQTTDKYILGAAQYKDKLLYGTTEKQKDGYWKYFTHVQQGNEDKLLGEYSLLGTEGNTAHLFNVTNGQNYEYSLDRGSLGAGREYSAELDGILNNKHKNHIEVFYVTKLSDEEGNDTEYIKFSQNNPEGYYYRVGLNSFTKIDTDLDKSSERRTEWVSINNTLYAVTYSKDEKTVQLIKYTLSGNKFVEDKAFGKRNITGLVKGTLTIDHNDNLWFLQKDGKGMYAVKAEEADAVKKYQVSDKMNKMTVYDDNNLTVWNTHEKVATSINKRADMKIADKVTK